MAIMQMIEAVATLIWVTFIAFIMLGPLVIPQMRLNYKPTIIALPKAVSRKGLKFKINIKKKREILFKYIEKRKARTR